MKVPQNVNQSLTADIIREAISDYVLRNAEFPKQNDLTVYGITYQDIYFYCNGIKAAIKSIPQNIYEHVITARRNKIIQDLRNKLSIEYHSLSHYLQHEGKYFGSIPTYFGTWNNAVQAAFPDIDLTPKKKEKVIKPKPKKIEKQDVINFLETYIQTYRRIPTIQDFQKQHLYYHCSKFFGGIQKALNLINPDLLQLVKDKLKNDIIEDVRQKLTDSRLSIELFEKRGGNSYRAIATFGDWDAVLRASFSDKIVDQWNTNKLNKKRCTKEEYLQDFIDTSIIYGDCTKNNYIRHGKYNVDTYESIYFENHKNLIKEAAKISCLFQERCFSNKRLPIPISEAQYFEVPHKKRELKQEPYPLLKIIEEAENYYFNNDCSIRSYDYVNRLKKLPQKIINQYGGWKKFLTLTRIPEFEKTKALAQFKKEVEEIIEEHGYFSMKLHKDKPGTMHHTKLRDMFGSLAQLRIEAGLDVPEECYTSRTWAYTNQEYSDFLWKIYNKYGFISGSLIDNEPNHIARDRIVKHFGSLESACKKFGVPYKAPAHRSKFYFEIETKACNILQTECIQEKTWPWLKYKNRLRCDLFFPLLNLVIEIDGPQHYKNVRFFHESDKIYNTALLRDQIKNTELPKHGIDLIRIDSRNVKQIEQILASYKAKRDLIYNSCAF